MRIKTLGAAVAAALLGLSTAAFGQAGASGSPAPAGGTTVQPQVPGAPKTDSSSAGTGTQAAPSATMGASGSVRDTARCDAMTGTERERCLRDTGDRASTGPGNPTTPDSVNRLPQRTDPTPPRSEDRTAPTTPRR